MIRGDGDTTNTCNCQVIKYITVEKEVPKEVIVTKEVEVIKEVIPSNRVGWGGKS